MTDVAAYTCLDGSRAIDRIEETSRRTRTACRSITFSPTTSSVEDDGEDDARPLRQRRALKTTAKMTRAPTVVACLLVPAASRQDAVGCLGRLHATAKIEETARRIRAA